MLRLILGNKGSLETCVRGHSEEYFYDSEGRLTETVDMVPGEVVLNIEKGQWHTVKALESGSVILEMKEGKYEPTGPEDILEV